MGKPTISMTIFNSFLLVYQRVVHEGFDPTYGSGAYHIMSEGEAPELVWLTQEPADSGSCDAFEVPSWNRGVSQGAFSWISSFLP
jgi:hypothetical protein